MHTATNTHGPFTKHYQNSHSLLLTSPSGEQSGCSWSVPALTCVYLQVPYLSINSTLLHRHTTTLPHPIGRVCVCDHDNTCTCTLPPTNRTCATHAAPLAHSPLPPSSLSPSLPLLSLLSSLFLLSIPLPFLPPSLPSALPCTQRKLTRGIRGGLCLVRTFLLGPLSDVSVLAVVALMRLLEVSGRREDAFTHMLFPIILLLPPFLSPSSFSPFLSIVFLTPSLPPSLPFYRLPPSLPPFLSSFSLPPSLT